MSTSELSWIVNEFSHHGCYCMRSMKKHDGYKQKMNWTVEQSNDGLRYVTVQKNGKPAGFIEYTDGEKAWRVVHARDYIVIHCLWVGITNEGIGSKLIKECIEYASAVQKKGVAVVTNSDTSWAPSEQIFEKNGFVCVDEAPFGFKLYAYTLTGGDQPSFPSDWDERLAVYNTGLTIIRSHQCPYLEVATTNLIEAAQSLNIEPHIIVLNSREELMEISPTPYGVFQVIYKGELVSFHRMTPRSFAKHLQHIDMVLG